MSDNTCRPGKVHEPRTVDKRSKDSVNGHGADATQCCLTLVLVKIGHFYDQGSPHCGCLASLRLSGLNVLHISSCFHQKY